MAERPLENSLREGEMGRAGVLVVGLTGAFRGPVILVENLESRKDRAPLKVFLPETVEASCGIRAVRGLLARGVALDRVVRHYSGRILDFLKASKWGQFDPGRARITFDNRSRAEFLKSDQWGFISQTASEEDVRHAQTVFKMLEIDSPQKALSLLGEGNSAAFAAVNFVAESLDWSGEGGAVTYFAQALTRAERTQARVSQTQEELIGIQGPAKVDTGWDGQVPWISVVNCGSSIRIAAGGSQIAVKNNMHMLEMLVGLEPISGEIGIHGVSAGVAFGVCMEQAQWAKRFLAEALLTIKRISKDPS
ncbi:hypothetical protein A2870_03505 [Candidatus Curtissbacteria bacterium RIFCSPHIGHO2_01_FULL_41_11]|uniref:Uncharacterized protein n=1 Tax=Candidatus Curtissbacteria bacterium RIFCSPHIGHO2_01_FULL_41_11 TaxID=1797711 RepID=A0A1F5G5S5_9BACT|nr:MAG: hypothetical protein A2870_03505 [Candidatus Curtissbacteria bacterium RIFCSPHIGHO2_01_FULL_41_11]